MDLEYFLKERTRFTRYFYENAASSFKKTIELIEAGKEPFVPPYSEDGEPPFMAEWLDARDALDSVGLAAVTMLSSSLQLFLSSWADRLDHGEVKFKRTNKQKGWLFAYREIILNVGLDFSNCPANFELIEQAVLIRNRAQHADELTSLGIRYSESDMEKYPSLHFISDADRHLLEKGE